MPARYTKDPAELLDYSWDWSAWLAEVNDVIGSATVVANDGLTAVGEPTVTDTVVTQRISGGALGTSCTIVCQITTVSGLIGERTIYLTIAEQ
jgi:NADPH-dependent curcumin reductase CurA